MSLSNSSFVTTSYHVIRNLFRKNTAPKIRLGRWGINSMNKSGLVADYSNEDHCGTCAQYVAKKKVIYNNDFIEENLMYEFESISMNIPSTNDANK
jgi:hypothetical protein